MFDLGTNPTKPQPNTQQAAQLRKMLDTIKKLEVDFAGLQESGYEAVGPALAETTDGVLVFLPRGGTANGAEHEWERLPMVDPETGKLSPEFLPDSLKVTITPDANAPDGPATAELEFSKILVDGVLSTDDDLEISFLQNSLKAGREYRLRIISTDASEPRNITWPADVRWSNGAPLVVLPEEEIIVSLWSTGETLSGVRGVYAQVDD